jgi:nucleotide-binding universal stress UspA family protein
LPHTALRQSFAFFSRRVRCSEKLLGACRWFGDFAQGGAKRSCAWRKASGGELVLLYVAARFLNAYGFESGMYQAVTEKIYNERIEASSHELLERVRQSLDPGGVVHARWVMSDRTEEAIVKAAQADDCDLIVIATHGRGAIGRALLGSVTSRLLPISPVPVLVYRDATMVPA